MCFSHPKDERVEQQHCLHAKDHWFGFHPPGSHNLTEPISISLSPLLCGFLKSLALFYIPIFLPLSLKLRKHQTNQRLNCKTNKNPTNNEQ